MSAFSCSKKWGVCQCYQGYFPVQWPDELIMELSFLLAYSTVSGVNGPLVILDNVKVRMLTGSIFIKRHALQPYHINMLDL